VALHREATSTAETSGSVSVSTVFDPDNPIGGFAIASVDPRVFTN
jgi:hypothetical protein